ncbi:hypothetical protein FPZ54_07845 [Sphingomonas suaedae]|uniref:LPXTG cell wall anchor domain-containing protein n=1 Tax=Sphingomonas suaedae TaxID=2599297 RepID=A0A518RET6_9SPHN|nr:hypothetical protein [Sphingomonas suaedae]QDX25943.1 hypothetical protein FPZ54_07845 [Sphingomonas suaedae]
MTHTANHARPALRRAAALLLAAAAFPSTALAQEAVTPPMVLVPAQPAPAPAPVAPPQVQVPSTTTTTVQTPPGESRTTIAPAALEQAEAEARERAAARQAEARQAEARQAAARQARATRAAAPAAPAPAPNPEPAPQAEAAPAPEALTPVPPPADPAVQAAPVEPQAADELPAPVEQSEPGGTMWLILAALGGIAVVIAGAMLLRRRRDDEPYVEKEMVVAAPVERPVQPVAEREIESKPIAARAEPRVDYPVADPVAAAPVLAGFVAPRPEPKPVAAPVRAKTQVKPGRTPALEHAEMVDADPADIAAVLGDAKPTGSRPQLELAMRPIRAGMSRRGAMVGFELTVANAGAVSADDVRIGAFMLGENAARETEIERLLVNPPVESIRPAERIAPGDGTTLEGSLTMSREEVDAIAGDDEGFTPVLVADARYRLPDGREGRTAAAFKIGRVNGGAHLVPIAIQDDPSMYADIEAELLGVPAKV